MSTEKTFEELMHAEELNIEQQKELVWQIYIKCREIRRLWDCLSGFEKEQQALIEEMRRRCQNA